MTDVPTPPIAKIVPHTHEIHEETSVDNYFWLRYRDDPQVSAYLEAENAYVAAVMEPTESLQQQLYAEMHARIKDSDISVPTQCDDYFYYTRIEEGQQYRLYCRKHGSLDAPEEVLLDLNALAVGQGYLRLGVYRVSPDHRRLAYSLDRSGAEGYDLYIKELATDKLLDMPIPNTYYDVEWANDSTTLFYTMLNEAKRPYKVYRHEVGTNPSGDTLVYHEADDAFPLALAKTRSRAYILLIAHSLTSTEVRFVAADAPFEPFEILQERQANLEYSVAHHGDHFFILTNDDAKNFRVMQTAVSHPGKEHWQELVPHRATAMVEGMDVFAQHLVLYERENGLKQIRVTDLQGNDIHYVDFSEATYAYRPGQNPTFDTTTLRFVYTSFTVPPTVIDYDMETRSQQLRKQEEVSNYDPSQYQSERLFAVAKDGTRIPLSIVYRKGIAHDGNNPTLLYGYGAYGASMDATFSANRVSLLDRGFVFAIAHVRGGEELGRDWYEQGKLLHKQNSFGDFIACAEHLIAHGYTSSEQLAIMGVSAGGLLVAAVTTQRPELFHAVIAKVPFVDVINTMLDESLPLVVNEFEEWGNPKDRTFFEYMRAYSPYDNIAARDYPNLLITTSLNDVRVLYWEPAKWAAKLRSLKTDHNVLLLKTNMGAGHGGASGRYDALKETAFEYAFLLMVLGVA